MSAKKDIGELRRKAEQQGFTVSVRRSGHLKWEAPSGAFITTAATPSSDRTLRNVTADLKKIGFDPNWQKPRKETMVVPVRELPDRTPIADSKESANCVVAGCGKRFLHTRMNEHLREAHNIWQCPACERQFTKLQNLAVHASKVHHLTWDGRTPDVACFVEGCNYMGTSEKSLETHLSRVHNATRTELLILDGKKVNPKHYNMWLKTQAAFQVDPQVPDTPKAPEEPIETPVVAPVSVSTHEITDESLLAVLELLCGEMPMVPLTKMGAVTAWMNSTRQLLEVLK